MSLIRLTLVAVSPVLAPKKDDPKYTVTAQQPIWVNTWGVNTVRAFDNIGTPATRIRMDDGTTFEVAEAADYVADSVNFAFDKEK